MMDKRTFTWRRIVELQQLFTSALTGASVELSPLRKLKVEQAAHAVAVAELARGEFMRDGAGDLDELIRAERRADTLVKWSGPDLSGLSDDELDRLKVLLREAEGNAG